MDSAFKSSPDSASAVRLRLGRALRRGGCIYIQMRVNALEPRHVMPRDRTMIWSGATDIQVETAKLSK